MGVTANLQPFIYNSTTNIILIIGIIGNVVVYITGDNSPDFYTNIHPWFVLMSSKLFNPQNYLSVHNLPVDLPTNNP